MLHLTTINLLLLLLLVHLWYDFHVQGNFIASNKSSSDLILAVHAATWALALSVPLYLTHHFSYWILAFLFGTHFLMDRLKARGTVDRYIPASVRKLTPRARPATIALTIDQAVHLLTIAAVVLWF